MGGGHERGFVRMSRRARVGRRRLCPFARRRPGTRGQSLVELAISGGLFLVLALAVGDGGRLFAYREAVTNADRQMLLAAASPAQRTAPEGLPGCASAGSSPVAVTGVTHIPIAVGDPATLNAIAEAGGSEGAGDGASTMSRVKGATVTITWHCVNGKAITNGTANGITDPDDLRSDAIVVRVSYPFTLITPFVGALFSGQTVQLSSGVVGRARY